MSTDLPLRKFLQKRLEDLTKYNEIHQWVKNVKGFSSEYSTTTWSHNMIKGYPTVFPVFLKETNK